MKWYTVTREEFSGYDCDGHEITHIVAANSPEEAASLFLRVPGDRPVEVHELSLPDLSRKRNPFIYPFIYKPTDMLS